MLEWPAGRVAEVTVQRQHSAKTDTVILDAAHELNQRSQCDTVSENRGVKAGVALLSTRPSGPSNDFGLPVLAFLESVKLEVFILREHILERGHSKVPTKLYVAAATWAFEFLVSWDQQSRSGGSNLKQN